MDTVPIMIAGVFVALAALIVTMIGSLRRDIDKRFDGVDKRMDGMEKRFDDRFDGVDRRMDGMEKRFDDRFDRMEKRFDNRFDGIDKRLDGVDGRLRSVEQGLAEVRGRIAFVESYILGRNEPAPEETPAE